MSFKSIQRLCTRKLQIIALNVAGQLVPWAGHETSAYHINNCHAPKVGIQCLADYLSFLLLIWLGSSSVKAAFSFQTLLFTVKLLYLSLSSSVLFYGGWWKQDKARERVGILSADPVKSLWQLPGCFYSVNHRWVFAEKKEDPGSAFHVRFKLSSHVSLLQTQQAPKFYPAADVLF